MAKPKAIDWQNAPLSVAQYKRRFKPETLEHRLKRVRRTLDANRNGTRDGRYYSAFRNSVCDEDVNIILEIAEATQ